MKKINKTMALALIATLLILPHLVIAVDLDGEISSEDKATFDKILEPVTKVYNLVKYAATAIAALILLVAGVTYMMSGSDPRKRDNSKNMAMYVLIGLLIIWAAPFVVQFIVN